jgi:hypothetical protein
MKSLKMQGRRTFGEPQVSVSGAHQTSVADADGERGHIDHPGELKSRIMKKTVTQAARTYV